MLESCKNAQERWGGVHLLIDRWLQERNELIKAFDALGDTPQALVEDRKRLQDFCGLLVDYTSAGHFEIYEQLTDEAKAFNDKRGLELADTIWPRIDEITQKALDFNDYCDKGDCSDAAVSVLGVPFEFWALALFAMATAVLWINVVTPRRA